MITVLQGSSGSGKSFVGYSLLRDFPHEPVHWPPGHVPNKNKAKWKLVGYTLPGDLFVVGSYDADHCGGADSIGGGFPKMQFPFIERCALRFTHVFIESLMASLCAMSYWLELREQLDAAQAPSRPLVFPTLNTPRELCLQRIYERNGGRAINEGATHANWRRIHYKRDKLERAGFYAPYVDHEGSYDHVRKLLDWGGWRP